MKKLILIFWMTLGMLPSFSQENSDARQKIESARIALITERLGLSPEQAEKFWPVYREYANERNVMLKEFKTARDNVSRRDLTEEESQRLIDLGLKLKERQLMLDKQYSERLTQVISSRQLLALRKAEDDFRRMLLERLERRREMQQRMQRRRDQTDN